MRTGGSGDQGKVGSSSKWFAVQDLALKVESILFSPMEGIKG